jgi:hypothetical protein
MGELALNFTMFVSVCERVYLLSISRVVTCCKNSLCVGVS